MPILVVLVPIWYRLLYILSQPQASSVLSRASSELDASGQNIRCDISNVKYTKLVKTTFMVMEIYIMPTYIKIIYIDLLLSLFTQMKIAFVCAWNGDLDCIILSACICYYFNLLLRIYSLLCMASILLRRYFRNMYSLHLICVTLFDLVYSQSFFSLYFGSVLCRLVSQTLSLVVIDADVS